MHPGWSRSLLRRQGPTRTFTSVRVNACQCMSMHVNACQCMSIQFIMHYAFALQAYAMSPPLLPSTFTDKGLLDLIGSHLDYHGLDLAKLDAEIKAEDRALSPEALACLQLLHTSFKAIGVSDPYVEEADKYILTEAQQTLYDDPRIKPFKVHIKEHIPTFSPAMCNAVRLGASVIDASQEVKALARLKSSCEVTLWTAEKEMSSDFMDRISPSNQVLLEQARVMTEQQLKRVFDTTTGTTTSTVSIMIDAPWYQPNPFNVLYVTVLADLLPYPHQTRAVKNVNPAEAKLVLRHAKEAVTPPSINAVISELGDRPLSMTQRCFASYWVDTRTGLVKHMGTAYVGDKPPTSSPYMFLTRFVDLTNAKSVRSLGTSVVQYAQMKERGALLELDEFRRIVLSDVV